MTTDVADPRLIGAALALVVGLSALRSPGWRTATDPVGGVAAAVLALAGLLVALVAATGPIGDPNATAPTTGPVDVRRDGAHVTEVEDRLVVASTSWKPGTVVLVVPCHDDDVPATGSSVLAIRAWVEDRCELDHAVQRLTDASGRIAASVAAPSRRSACQTARCTVMLVDSRAITDVRVVPIR